MVSQIRYILSLYLTFRISMSITSLSLPTPSQLLLTLLHTTPLPPDLPPPSPKQSLLSNITTLHQRLSTAESHKHALNQALQHRALLRQQLQALLQERRQLEKETTFFVERVKMEPVEIRGVSQCWRELEEIREVNCRLGVRLRDVRAIVGDLEETVMLREGQGRGEKENCGEGWGRGRENSGSSSDGGVLLDQYGDIDWREKIRTYKLEEQKYTQRFKRKMDIEKIRRGMPKNTEKPIQSIN